MHHRRSRNPRREGKRLDNKAYRGAESRAIENGVSNGPLYDRWGYRPKPLPLGDVPCESDRRGKRKKGGKKRTRCPEGGAHEWYYEWLEEREFFRDYVRNCENCAVQREKWIAEKERWKRLWGYEYKMYECPYNPIWCHLHGEQHFYTKRTKIGTCLKCWTVKTVKRTSDLDELYPDRSLYGYPRKRYLPKRSVKF